MSQENVEIVRRLTEAMVRGDPDSFVACCSPDVDWEENTAAFFGLRANYRGHEAIREWFQEAVVENWDAISFEIEENVEAPDGRVLTGGVLTARGKGSGVQTRRRFWFVVWVKNGKITRRQVFLDRKEALEAAGLSEQDAHSA
jgi:ketosteroid isomerase-like protein